MNDEERLDEGSEYRRRLVDAKVNELMEHFDSIRIFVSFRGSPTTTQTYTTGGGNFHAQMGQVKEWVIRQDEFVREDARHEQAEEYE